MAKQQSMEDPKREYSPREFEKVETALERMKRHWSEAAGRVWVPEVWGQEELLREWSDCSAFERSLVSKELWAARLALMAECRRGNSGGLGIENRCS
ncbi:hypothetical protein HPP92_006025 [Vanilla planifolia]|uniref:Uncharacterized protein n=1 Tax=Vanilla planifolia TaxID=51239 RepID=A0A835RUS3_VANPL|nr:hypothetical protein HPP92_006353 [Vanilla planifolia]KAG0495031.1 hypothetical protein HPP92_006025 [Vanilla planifolia]